MALYKTFQQVFHRTTIKIFFKQYLCNIDLSEYFWAEEMILPECCACWCNTISSREKYKKLLNNKNLLKGFYIITKKNFISN